MIRCSKCGTLNRDASRFCNECGNTLQRTQVRCPMCGTMNPVGNVFCDRCNARLTPLQGVVPGEEPIAPSEDTITGVRGISLPARASTDVQTDPTKEEIPDWLHSLLEDSSDTTAQPNVVPSSPTDLPDWLGDANEEPAAPPEITLAAADEFPDWLSDIGSEEPAAPPKITSAAADEFPDWLSDMGSEEPAAPSEITSAAADEFPDWLSDMGSEEPAAPPEIAPAAADEFPDWLSDMGSEEPAAPPEIAPAAADEFPDWLSDMGSEELAAPPEITPAAADEFPDWLSGMGIEEPIAPPEAAPAAVFETSDKLDDWLSSLSGVTSAPDDTVQEPTERSSGWLSNLDTQQVPDLSDQAVEQMPEWLRDAAIKRRGTGPLTPPTPAFLADEADDDSPPPDTLPRKSAPARTLPKAPQPESTSSKKKPSVDSATEALPAESVPPGALPEWLRELTPTSEDAPVPQRPSVPLEQGALPSWVAELRPSGTPGLPEIGDGVPPLVEGLEPGELPEWVQEMRPTVAGGSGLSLEEALQSTIAETEGPLVGLKRIIPAAPVVDIPQAYQPRPQATIPESVLDRAQVWQNLLERPRGAERPVALPRSQPGWSEVVTRVFIVLMLMATLAAAFVFIPTGIGSVPLGQPPAQAGIPPLVRTIAALPQGARVVVAFEYGVAESDEMHPLAQPLLNHLLEREVQLKAVSTLPEGTGIAYALLTEAVAYHTSVTDILTNTLTTTLIITESLSYLPGDSSGIAHYLTTAPDFDLLIVVAARPERLRWWVEQNTLLNTPHPTLAVLSAATGPFMTPYLESQSVAGWLVGYPGAAAYAQARGIAPDEMAVRKLDALMLSHYIAAGLILLGMLYSLFAGSHKRG